MIKYDDTTFVLVKDKKNKKYLCPLNSGRMRSAKSHDLQNECIGEEVVGRYAGNINVES